MEKVIEFKNVVHILDSIISIILVLCGCVWALSFFFLLQDDGRLGFGVMHVVGGFFGLLVAYAAKVMFFGISYCQVQIALDTHARASDETS